MVVKFEDVILNVYSDYVFLKLPIIKYNENVIITDFKDLYTLYKEIKGDLQLHKVKFLHIPSE